MAGTAQRIRDLLAGGRIDVSAAEATLGYRLRQYHVGLVCWVGDAASAADEITRLEQAIDAMRKTRAQMRPPSFQIRDAKTGERVDLRTVLTRALRAHEKVALREKFLAGGLRMEVG